MSMSMNAEWKENFIISLTNYCAFHRGINRENAESMLLTQPIGTFLLRNSSEPGNYVASVRIHDGIDHRLIKFGPSYIVYSDVQRDFFNWGELVFYWSKENLKPLKVQTNTNVMLGNGTIEFLLNKRIGNYGWVYNHDHDCFVTQIMSAKFLTFFMQVSNMGIDPKMLKSEGNDAFSFYYIPAAEIFEVLNEAVNIRTLLNEKVGLVGWKAVNKNSDRYSTNKELSFSRASDIKTSLKTQFGLDCEILPSGNNTPSSQSPFFNSAEVNYYVEVETGKLIAAIKNSYAPENVSIDESKKDVSAIKPPNSGTF